MRIKNTAFIYNVTVNGSSNCDWGTDIGQSSKHTFTLDGFPEILNAMVYYKIEDIENLKVILGKGNRTLKPFSDYPDTLVLASCFNKVYMNETLLENQSFIMYILKETAAVNSKGVKNVHQGRCTLKYSNSLHYRNTPTNQNCIDAISSSLGLTKDGSWAILEMRIVNEDELHFYGFSLGNQPKNYNSIEERNTDFSKFTSVDNLESRRSAFKAYLFNPGTFKHPSTARLYWNHISVDKYKERLDFIWEALTSILGHESSDLVAIDNMEDAKKLKDAVLSDPRNKKYGNMLASAIIKNYIDFLDNFRTKPTHTIAPKVNSSNTQKVTPAIDTIELSDQDYRYIAAMKTKPFIILGGFSGTGKSQKVKEMAFATCPCDGELNISETSPGNYLLISVKPNWHDATEITGFRSSVNKNYYVTDFMRFLVKAKQYPEVPFFVCLDEMNLAPVEEYFADFLSVIESRKKKNDGSIVTDAIIPACVFNANDYATDFNIFMSLGLLTTKPDMTADEYNTLSIEDRSQSFIRQDIVNELKTNGLTIPQNVIIIGTVNMDDTTNSFSRKVIDRAMTFETLVCEFNGKYFQKGVSLNYVKNSRKGELFISDEVNAVQAIESGSFELSEDEQKSILSFINNINKDLDGSPYKISFRIMNETILLYRAKKRIAEIIESEEGFEEGISFNTDLNNIFDEILMQKILPRIEGDYEKCNKCLTELSIRAEDNEWRNSFNKIEFMIKRFGKDKSGFTSFWN